MTTLNPYIYFNGNCEEAFTFYKSVFRKDFNYIGRYKDVPSDSRTIFPEEEEKIMHVTLPISNETILMGSDNSEAFENAPVYKSFSLIIHTDTKEEADRIFNELSDQGQVKLSLDLTFWGSYYGICMDRFGITWKVTTETIR